MRIIVSGNKEPFQLTERITPIEIELSIIKLAPGQFSFILIYDGSHINIPLNSLYQIAESIKGRYSLDIAFSLSRLLPEYPEFSNSFLSKNQTETSIFKSVFLIYTWIEIALTDAYAVGLGSKIYNEFIVDASNIPGSQSELYFLKRERITERNKPYIDRLIELNLLVKTEFFDGTIGNYTTYFIPLLKPGVSRSYFANPRDILGNNTHSFWKEILDDRDSRLRFWMQNRF